jgi:hypothetical protein
VHINLVGYICIQDTNKCERCERWMIRRNLLDEKYSDVF